MRYIIQNFGHILSQPVCVSECEYIHTEIHIRYIFMPVVVQCSLELGESMVILWLFCIQPSHNFLGMVQDNHLVGNILSTFKEFDKKIIIFVVISLL